MEKIHEEIEACRKVLKGETVNGIKLGDAGITEEWVRQTLASLEEVANKK